MTPEEIMREVRTAATLSELGDANDRELAQQIRTRLGSLGRSIKQGFISQFEGALDGLTAENFEEAYDNIINGSRQLIQDAIEPASKGYRIAQDAAQLGILTLPDSAQESFRDPLVARAVDTAIFAVNPDAPDNPTAGILRPAPAPTPIDAGRNFIDPSDPIQQIVPAEGETVVNNGLEANEGVATVLPLLGPVKRPIPTPSPDGFPGRPSQASGVNAPALPANPFDELLNRENAAAAAEVERIRLRGLDEQALLDQFTGNINQANAFSNTLNQNELANTLALDEYGRRVLEAGLIGTAQTQSSQQVINRLAGLPGLGGEISAIAPALAQANPLVSVPDITPGIRAQSGAVENNFRQNNAASADLRAQLSQRVTLQNSLRTDLQRLIAGRLRGE